MSSDLPSPVISRSSWRVWREELEAFNTQIHSSSSTAAKEYFGLPYRQAKGFAARQDAR